MLAFGLLALGAAALAAAILTALAIGAEDADPATSRALLDLADVAVGISGPGFSLALIACAFGALKVPGTLPAPLVPLSLLTAAATLLWAGRLLSDGDALAAGSFAGSALGWLLLLIWIGANGLWLARRRSPDYRAPIQ